MNKTVLKWMLDYIRGDGLCDGCNRLQCARLDDAAHCPLDGKMLGWAEEAFFLITDEEQETRERKT